MGSGLIRVPGVPGSWAYPPPPAYPGSAKPNILRPTGSQNPQTPHPPTKTNRNHPKATPRRALGGVGRVL